MCDSWFMSYFVDQVSYTPVTIVLNVTLFFCNISDIFQWFRHYFNRKFSIFFWTINPEILRRFIAKLFRSSVLSSDIFKASLMQLDMIFMNIYTALSQFLFLKMFLKNAFFVMNQCLWFFKKVKSLKEGRHMEQMFLIYPGDTQLCSYSSRCNVNCSNRQQKSLWMASKMYVTCNFP